MNSVSALPELSKKKFLGALHVNEVPRISGIIDFK